MEAVILMLVLGVGLGLIIGIAAKFFAVHHDPRIEQTEELLPGANCGACGFAGCADFARALVMGETEPAACPSNEAENIEKIAALLGLNAGTREKKVAVVRCGGDNQKARRAAHYNGVADCKSAAAVAGGAKGCLYGCLGLASCARACPFDAIEIRDGLAIVHNDLCTGCGKCVATCPRNLIILVPAEAPVHIYCNSPEKGGAKKKVCDVSCIGCRKCFKEAEGGQVEMDGFLARVNYDNPPGEDVAAVCPTGCFHDTDF